MGKNIYIPSLRTFREEVNKLTDPQQHSEITMAQIPTSAVLMHKRVMMGQADLILGHEIKICAVIPTDLDKDRFPNILKDAQCIWMVYNTRRARG